MKKNGDREKERQRELDFLKKKKKTKNFLDDDWVSQDCSERSDSCPKGRSGRHLRLEAMGIGQSQVVRKGSEEGYLGVGNTAPRLC